MTNGDGGTEHGTGSGSTSAGETGPGSGPGSDGDTGDWGTDSGGTAGTGGSTGSTGGDSGTDTGGGGGCGPDGRWCPTPGTTWQWQLTGTIDQSWDVAMYDVDLFDTPVDVIADLQGAGRVVICYFSAGSFEDWRPDAGDFPQPAIGDPLGMWPGEWWLDHRDAQVRTIMAARLDLAVERGCDGVEPDNVDGYANASGFDLNGDDQLDYNAWLASEAHARGLSIGLKNDLDQVDDLVDDFDWALNEECQSYDECGLLQPFIAADKAVFHVEYVDDPADGMTQADATCPDALSRSFSTLIKEWDLGSWGIPCA